VQDKTTKEPRLNCRNWECGVLLPIEVVHGDSNQNATASRGRQMLDLLATFGGPVPVPMKVPSQRMGSKKPWTIFDG
jgi:hypothetical protein